MKNLAGKLVWILPMIIVLFGVAILFVHNYNEVTEPPDEKWSRELEVGKTSALQSIRADSSEDSHTVSFLTSDGLKQKKYDEDYNLLNEESYDFPVDKFTTFFKTDENFVFSDYYHLYNGKTEDEITAIDKFFPLESMAFYRKGQDVYSLNMKNMEGEELFTLPNPNTSLIFQETSNGIYFLTNDVDQSGHHITYYKVEDEQVKEVGNTDFTLKSSEEFSDMQFYVEGDTAKVLLTTIQKQSMSGKIEGFYYYDEFTFGEDLDLTKISMTDPVSSTELKEVSDIKMRSGEGGTELLFKAIGATKTKFRDSEGFNIYQAQVSTEGVSEITRISNTPNLSHDPSWMNSNTVIWLDKTSSEDRLLLASQNPKVVKEAKAITQANLIQALGKTMGMLSFSLFAIIITSFWFIWPLLFMVVIMFSKKDVLEKDHAWVFFTGGIIYLGAAIMVRHPIFSDSLMARAPEYLSFPGSPILFLVAFAVIAYGILKTGARRRDWSIPIQLTYFIFIHVLFVSVFFGPYVL
ncbi:hypothetical protein [Halobacillus litoralis]|uniref:hypothetical protein n=1 Tax=Halobacillus litoralis TaxID=45668 RepID=UPI001CFED817|nr:hypothetical protein [Halobacillus litoralis]